MFKIIKYVTAISILSIVLLSGCSMQPVEPMDGNTGFTFSIQDGEIPGPNLFPIRTITENSSLNKTESSLQTIDLVRILVIDLSAFDTINDFELSEEWQTYQDDLANWTGDLKRWDERKRLLKRHFRIVLDQVLDIENDNATGKITGIVGLNLFAIAFMEENEIRFYGQGDAIGIAGETQNANVAVERQSYGDIEVNITAPANGSTHATRVITVTGTVGDSMVTEGTLIVNQTPQTIAVTDGNFTNEVILSNGLNTIRVEVTNAFGDSGFAEITIDCQVPPVDIRVTLTWENSGTDLDLWVTDPNGERVYYYDKTSLIGGELDTDNQWGYGPENFTLDQGEAIPGNYAVEVDFWSGTLPSIATIVVLMYENQPNETQTTYGPHEFSVGNTANWQAVTIAWP